MIAADARDLEDVGGRRLRLISNQRLIVLACVAALVGCSAACGGGDGGGATASATAQQSSPGSDTTVEVTAIDELQDGILHVVTEIQRPARSSLDQATNQPVGLDVDLANALAEKLGLRVEFTTSNADELLPQLEDERIDAAMGVPDRPDLSEDLGFIDYLSAGSGIVLPAGNPKSVVNVDDLCGKTVAVRQDSVASGFISGTADEPGLLQKCEEQGNAALTVLTFSSDDAAAQAVASGSADAAVADFVQAAYVVQQSGGALELSPKQIDPVPYGIAVRKSSDDLRVALQHAFEQIKADGTYAAILQKWNLEAGAIE